MTSSPALYDWLVLLAIVLGPLLGVWVTRIVDGARETSRKREGILEGLIRTRGLELSPEHVSNLNLIPLYFREARVRSAYSKMMESVNDGGLSATDPAMVNAALQRLNANRQDLIREIARIVGNPLPENELERLGYAPIAWQRQWAEGEQLRSLMIEWLEGKRTTRMVAGIWELEPEPEPIPTPLEPSNPKKAGRKASAIKTTEQASLPAGKP